MKSIFFLFSLTLLFATCKKQPSEITADNLIFGYSYGECGGDCHHLFQLTAAQLFEDDCDFCPNTSIPFKNTPLSSAKFDLAKPLLSDVPDEILDIDLKRFGCPGCADGIVFQLIVQKNGKSHELQWDYDYEDVPTSLKPFLEKTVAVIDSL